MNTLQKITISPNHWRVPSAEHAMDGYILGIPSEEQICQARAKALEKRAVWKPSEEGLLLVEQLKAFIGTRVQLQFWDPIMCMLDEEGPYPLEGDCENVLLLQRDEFIQAFIALDNIREVPTPEGYSPLGYLITVDGIYCQLAPLADINKVWPINPDGSVSTELQQERISTIERYNARMQLIRDDPEMQKIYSDEKIFRVYSPWMEGDKINEETQYLRIWYRNHLGSRSELVGLEEAEQRRLEELFIERSGGRIHFLWLVEEGIKDGSLTVAGLHEVESGLCEIYRRYYDSFRQRFGSDYGNSVKPLILILLAAGEPLPEDLACTVLGWNNEQFLNCRGRLGGFVIETVTGYELCHKTLAEWLSDKASGSFHLDRTAGRQMIADVLFKEVADKDYHLVRWRKAIQQWLPVWLPTISQYEDVSALDNIGFWLKEVADYLAAQPLLERALSICEKSFGTEHPETANALNSLFSLFYDISNYEEAALLCRRALKIREKVCGPDHVQTADSLDNLAMLLMATGKYNEAELLYRCAVAIYENVRGPSHRTTANSLGNLALLLTHTGNHTEAKSFFLRASAILEKVCGSEHPDTARNNNNFGSLLQDIGDYKEAETLRRSALAIYEKYFGAKHPSTVTAMNNLSVSLISMGEYKQAESLNRRALAIREKYLGVDHPDTAYSLNNLAVTLDFMGDRVAAEALHRRALAIREVKLGDEHPDTAYSLYNLAGLLGSMGDHAAAETLHRRALAIREKILGDEHPDTAFSLYNLAQLLFSMGDYAAAEPLHRRALEIREKILGVEHVDTSSSLYQLTQLLCNMRDYVAAKPLFRRMLTTLNKRLGVNHSTTLKLMTKLPIICLRINANEATRVLELSIRDIEQRLIGDDTDEKFSAMVSLALIFDKLKMNNEASTLRNEVMTTRRQMLEEEQPQVIATFNLLLGKLCDWAIEPGAKDLEFRFGDQLGIASYEITVQGRGEKYHGYVEMRPNPTQLNIFLYSEIYLPDAFHALVKNMLDSINESLKDCILETVGENNQLRFRAEQQLVGEGLSIKIIDKFICAGTQYLDNASMAIMQFANSIMNIKELSEKLEKIESVKVIAIKDSTRILVKNKLESFDLEVDCGNIMYTQFVTSPTGETCLETFYSDGGGVIFTPDDYVFNVVQDEMIRVNDAPPMCSIVEMIDGFQRYVLNPMHSDNLDQCVGLFYMHHYIIKSARNKGFKVDALMDELHAIGEKYGVNILDTEESHDAQPILATKDALKESALEGNQAAAMELAKIYLDGSGVKKSKADAFAWVIWAKTHCYTNIDLLDPLEELYNILNDTISKAARKKEEKILADLVLLAGTRVGKEYKATGSEIPKIIERLQFGHEFPRFAVLMFIPEDSTDGEPVNLQYSVENNHVGFDWVLIGPRNIADKGAVTHVANDLGILLVENEMNGVKYLRYEGSKAGELGLQILQRVYKIDPSTRLDFLVKGFEW